MDLRASVDTRDAELSGLSRLFDGGTVAIYPAPMPSSTAMPAPADALCELRLPAPAFADPVDGSINAHPIAPQYANIAGRAAWCRFSSPDGTTLLDGDIGRTDSFLVLAHTDLEPGTQVTIQSFTLTSPE